MTAPLPDAVGVVERLHEYSAFCKTVSRDKGARVCNEAATLIQSQAARIAELEAGLRVLEIERKRPTIRLIHLKRAVAVQARSLLSEGEGFGDYAASGSVPSVGSDAPATPGEVGP